MKKQNTKCNQGVIILYQLKLRSNMVVSWSKIFLVVPNFAKILTTVKIIKKLMQEGLIFKGSEAAIWKFNKVSGPQ